MSVGVAEVCNIETESTQEDLNLSVSNMLSMIKDEIEDDSIIDLMTTPTDILLDKIEEYATKGLDKLTSEEEKTRHLISQELKSRVNKERW